MKLLSNMPPLSPIIDELLNEIHTKLARVRLSFSFCTTRIGFCSGFYPTTIVKDKVWVIWVRYLVVDHAHPTLELGYWENICTCWSTNLRASLDEFWPVLYSTRLSVKHIQEREAHTTKCPSGSWISGVAPSSLPVIFSRMVVFPAFRRPITSTRNRLQSCLISSVEMSMFVSYTKQRNRSDDAGSWTAAEVWSPNRVGDEDQNLIISAKRHLHSPQYTVHEIMRTRNALLTHTGLPSTPFTRGCIGTAWPCLAAVGVKCVPAVIKACIEGSPPYMYFLNLTTSSRVYQKRRKKYEEDHRWLSRFLQCVQLNHACTLGTCAIK